MFKFLKSKIKESLSKISKKIEEEPKEKVVEEKLEEIKEVIEEKEDISKEPEEEPKEKVVEEKLEELKEEKKGFFKKLKEKIIKEKQKEILKEPELKENPKEQPIQELKHEEKNKLFSTIKEKILTTRISESKFDTLFEDLEIGLLENNVAFEVVEKIKQDLKESLVDKPIKRGEVEKEITSQLKESIEDLFLIPEIDLIKKIKEKDEKPFVIVFFGQNGSGKTTTIAKIARLCQGNKLSVVLGAADSFRKGSIEQLEEWGRKLNVKVIKHDYGSDPAAICFDTIHFGKAHKIDVVLLDTAGRQHSNKDLMGEMEKVVRVSKPDIKIFVGETLAGSDIPSQVNSFKEAVGIDGVILTKADVDEKGGAIISTSFVTHRPILYLGCGQHPEDLKKFNKKEIMTNLGF